MSYQYVVSNAALVMLSTNFEIRISKFETNSNIKSSNDKNNLNIAMPGMSSVLIILILVIRYCFGFRISCFGLKNPSFHKAEPIISDRVGPGGQVFVNRIKQNGHLTRRYGQNRRCLCRFYPAGSQQRSAVGKPVGSPSEQYDLPVVRYRVPGRG